MEGDYSNFAKLLAIDVSIHTLAWRVTKMAESCSFVSLVSIHTLAWRVTLPV